MLQILFDIFKSLHPIKVDDEYEFKNMLYMKAEHKLDIFLQMLQCYL
jgi:hypothetical protein